MDNTENTTTAVPAAPAGTFDDFALCDELKQAVSEAGFVEPTPIQLKAIPPALSGRDILGQALTGTGKTAAFGLAGMQRIMGLDGLQMLVLTPTRELAAQVSSELYRLGKHTGLRPAAFTGGQSYSRQEEILRRGVNILVATPGRLIDLMDSGHFDGVNPAVIVVDEADEMLDMGFIDDVRTIFEHFPGPHQTMLFSATMPRQVVHLAESILDNPLNIETDCGAAIANNENIEQHFFVIEEYERTNAVIRLIDCEEVGKAIIFCRTREEADHLNILLGGRGYNVNCLHGDMEQSQRSRVMAAFRRGDFDILVATDVAARGLDVEDVTHVFNYHLPFDSRSYVHRIGRTGRAGKTGKAITLVTPREMRQLENIRRNVGAKISPAMIPTRSEVNRQRLEKLLAQLFASELDPELYNTIQEMIEKQDQDPAVLFTKMISRQLAMTADQGPENIGLPQEKVEWLMNGRRRTAPRSGGEHRRAPRPEREKRQRPPRDHEDAGEPRRGAGRRERPQPPRTERAEPRDDHAYGAPRRFGRKPHGDKAGQGYTVKQQYNPDGSPKLNRKQRRLLKFGPPTGQRPADNPPQE